MEVLATEKQVLVLAMHIDKTLAQLLEDGKRHGGVVDESATLSGSGYLAAHDAVGGIIFDVIIGEERLHVVLREVEMSFNDTSVCT